MQEPVWKERLIDSLNKTQAAPESRYFQLATIGTDGAPQCRTVVFRGFNECADIQFITDTRSQKWLELTRNSGIAVTWYFATTREQYRFTGTAILDHVSDKPRLHQWQKLSAAGKKQFLWGEPKNSRAQDHSLDVKDSDIPEIPPASFALASVRIEALDYLTLRGDPQQRTIYTKLADDRWVKQSVIP